MYKKGCFFNSNQVYLILVYAQPDKYTQPDYLSATKDAKEDCARPTTCTLRYSIKQLHLAGIKIYKRNKHFKQPGLDREQPINRFQNEWSCWNTAGPGEWYGGPQVQCSFDMHTTVVCRAFSCSAEQFFFSVENFPSRPSCFSSRPTAKKEKRSVEQKKKKNALQRRRILSIKDMLSREEKFSAEKKKKIVRAAMCTYQRSVVVWTTVVWS